MPKTWLSREKKTEAGNYKKNPSLKAVLGGFQFYIHGKVVGPVDIASPWLKKWWGDGLTGPNGSYVYDQ